MERMMHTLIWIWFFAFGVLAVAGYVRIARRLDAQTAHTATMAVTRRVV